MSRKDAKEQRRKASTSGSRITPEVGAPQLFQRAACALGKFGLQQKAAGG